jgi:predicted glycogen debranching enzyme
MDRPDTSREWLEADGLGGFASGTVSGIRTRRYHALLLAAVTPPTGRMVLVNGCEAWLETPSATIPLSSQRYDPDVIHPDGYRRIAAFEHEPWPRWTFALGNGMTIEHTIIAEHGRPAVGLMWRLQSKRKKPGTILCVRPLLSGRDYHALHRENDAFVFDPVSVEDEGRAPVVWRPYAGLPEIVVRGNGVYEHDPVWYRNFYYEAEAARGLDCIEDLASPGVFRWDLSDGQAVWHLSTDRGDRRRTAGATEPERKRRAAFATPLHRAADGYLVQRGRGRTIVAGYPWFTDWGRDTFIAMRGLCLAAGRLDEARGILLEWAGAISDGMLPNRFPDVGDAPEYNSVDAALWYIVAVHDYLAARPRVPPTERKRLRDAVGAILHGHLAGTRHGIRADADGLLAAGEPGVALTWMDAKAGDWVVTPRVGKPVEIQALWINALRIADKLEVPGEKWSARAGRAAEAFAERFWNEAAGCLYDVVDVDHTSGDVDASIRPNQIFAVGGLPWAVLAGPRARAVVDLVERTLRTPLGLRTLAPDDPRYVPRYEGGVWDRDGAYHQGTAWPWLMGAFVEAWVRVRGGTAAAARQARTRFLAPLIEHLEQAGLGHLSEIADGDPPHAPRGCPFQAWSLGEFLRLHLAVLKGPSRR